MKKFLFLICFILMAICSTGINIDNVYADEIIFADKAVYYNSEQQSLEVAGIPDGVEVQYYNNVGTLPGEYEASATFTLEGASEPTTLYATLTILPAQISGISLESKSFDYDGGVKSLSVDTLILPYGETATVVYQNNDQVDANEEGYLVSAILSHPYYETKTLQSRLYIHKLNYDISNIVFEGAQVEYDGQVHSLSYEGVLPQGLSVEYVNNSKKDAGDHIVELRFVNSNTNYNTPQSLYAHLNITPKVIQVSVGDLTFNGQVQTVVFQVVGTIGGEDANVSLSVPTIFNAGNYNTNIVVDNTNYKSNVDTISFYVEKARYANIIAPFPRETYFAGITLDDIDLPEGFDWVDGTQNVTCADTQFEAVYNMDKNNYYDYSINITVQIDKASINAEFPTLGSIEYGQRLSDVQFDNAHTLGTFEWANPNLYPNVDNDGFIMKLIPFDTDNYLVTSSSLFVVVQPIVLEVEFDNYSDIVYDGNQHKTVTATFSGVLSRDEGSVQLGLQYSGNAIGAGEYTVTAIVNNPNYIVSNDAFIRFSILKANQDVDIVSYDVYSDKLIFDRIVSVRVNQGEWVIADKITDLVENTDYQVEYLLKGDNNYNDSIVKNVYIKTTYSVSSINALIAELGDITLGSYEKLFDIINAYEILMPSDKELVDVLVLQSKINAYNALCADINGDIATNVTQSSGLIRNFLVGLSALLSVGMLMFVNRRFV